MLLRYSYRLYPEPGQVQALARAFRCARVVFSDGLRARQDAHAAGLPYITDAELSARLTAAKATPERAWLAEVSSVVLQNALADLNAAYRNFFASVTGKRKGRKVAPSRFRSRTNRRQAKIASPQCLRRAEVARQHARVADSRRDWLHKLSTEIIRENQAVYVEDLCVAGLVRTRQGKSVSDAGWSACGVRDGPKPLSVRTWTCAACGVTHDRDVNAARNILALGRRERLNACGGKVRPGAIPAPASEPGTPRGAT